MVDLNEEELQELYAWIDDIPLSRQKKNIARDFSDGVMAAEVVHHFIPRLVELHNYSPANATQQKMANWKTLNRKVFSRLKFCVSEEFLQGVVGGKSGVIEFILTTLRTRIECYLQTVAHSHNLSAQSPLVPSSETTQLLDPDYEDQSWFSQPAPDERVRQENPDQDMMALSRATLTKKPSHKPASKLQSNPLHAVHASTHPASRIPLPINKQTSMKPSFSGSAQTLPALVESTSKSSLPGGVTSYGGILTTRRPAVVAPAAGPAGRKLSRDNAMAMKIRLAEKDQQLLQTQEFIQYLQMKLTRYEHLVQIKDMKIENLKKELEDARNAVRQTQLLQRPYQRR